MTERDACNPSIPSSSMPSASVPAVSVPFRPVPASPRRARNQTKRPSRIHPHTLALTDRAPPRARGVFRMNFIRTFSRSLKRVVLGSDDEECDSEEDGGGFTTRSRRRARAKSRSTPVVESAVSDLSGLAHGGVQGLNWVEACEKVDDDGDAAHGFIVCEDERGVGSVGTKRTRKKTREGKRAK